MCICCVQGGDNAEHGGQSYNARVLQEARPSVTHRTWQGLHRRVAFCVASCLS